MRGGLKKARVDGLNFLLHFFESRVCRGLGGDSTTDPAYTTSMLQCLMYFTIYLYELAKPSCEQKYFKKNKKKTTKTSITCAYLAKGFSPLEYIYLSDYAAVSLRAPSGFF